MNFWRIAGFKLPIVVVLTLAGGVDDAFGSFFQLNVDQRFFDEERLGNVNGFSPYVAPQFEAQFGWAQLGWGVHLISSAGYLQNSSVACAVDEQQSDQCLSIQGQPVESEDEFKFKILSFGQGLRFNFFQKSVFQPYLQSQLIYRYAWVKKESFATDELLKVSGYDLGAEFMGGVVFSLAQSSQKTRWTMASEWDFKDFGLGIHARYLPAGFLKKGLGRVQTTGGWSFGLGVQGQW